MQQNLMDQNIIINEPSKNLRAIGRNALAGKWKISCLALLVMILCIAIPTVILNALFGIKTDLYGMQSEYDVDVYSSIYNTMPSLSIIASIYMILVSGAFTLGIIIFFLTIFRREDAKITDVFLGFEHFGKALGLMLFQTLWIYIWTFLLIVPGIIAAIRYSQAFYILADNPDKGIRECMNESKMMMKGNKAKYFCLNLSFIGWLLLASIPGGIIQGIATVLYASQIVQILVTILTYILIIPVTAYMQSTFVGFYEILAGHLIKNTTPAPIAPLHNDVQNDVQNEPKESLAPSLNNEAKPQNLASKEDDNKQSGDNMFNDFFDKGE